MNSIFIRQLTVNASLLLTACIIYNALYSNYRKNKNLYGLVFGTIAGIVGILLMMNSAHFATGIMFDTRSILVSATGMFFGFIPSLIAVLIISICRIMIGGAGTLTGVLVTVLTAGIGLLWHHFRLQHILIKKKNVWPEFYVFGLITHVVMLLCMLTLPHNMAFTVLKEISLPVLLGYPIGSLLLCLVLFAGFKNMKTQSDLEESELRFRTMFEQAPMGIAVVNDNQNLYVNLMFEKILGRPKEDLTAMGWEEYTHPDDLQADRDKFAALQSGKINTYAMIKRYIRPDGSIVWVNMIIAALDMDNPSESNHLCMVQDITEMINARETARKSEANYKNLYLEFQRKQILLVSLLDSIPDLIFYKDVDGKYMGCNKAFGKFADMEADKIIGRTDFDLFDKEMAERFREMDIIMINQKQQQKNEELVSYPDGSKVYLDTLKTPYYDPEGHVLGMIGVSRDISERRQKEEKILYLNYHDVLTGLYNRTFFDEEQQRLDTESHLPLSVIIGDINGLRLINDAFGYAEGDKLLVEISKILRECCRAEDIIARTGGDEFSILLPKTDSALARNLFDRIKKTCEEYALNSDNEVYYTSISLGYATKIRQDEPFYQVLKVAEEYMYRRKLLAQKSLHSAIISSIKTTMFEKSNETEEHAERLADLSRKLGQAIGLSEEDLVSLELVATLHDIGKISVDQNILTKRGRLTDAEWAEMKKHPEVGYRIAQTVPELRSISEYILCHHEKWDGTGYPQGLSGEDIPLLSRILAIVDSYDAMTQDRSYRKAMTKDAAIAEIIKNAGTQFDPENARIFVEKVLNKSDD